jgi:hypothetical protein
LRFENTRASVEPAQQSSLERRVDSVRSAIDRSGQCGAETAAHERPGSGGLSEGETGRASRHHIAGKQLWQLSATKYTISDAFHSGLAEERNSNISGDLKLRSSPRWFRAVSRYCEDNPRAAALHFAQQVAAPA